MGQGVSKKAVKAKKVVVEIRIFGLEGKPSRVIFRVNRSRVSSVNQDLTMLFYKYR